MVVVNDSQTQQKLIPMKAQNIIHRFKKGLTIALVAFLTVGSASAIAGDNPSKENINRSSGETESEIKLETWMMDLSKWFSNIAINLEEEIYEEEIILENWMTNANDSTWAGIIQSIALEKKVDCIEAKVDTDPEMVVEDWMTDITQW